MTEETELIFSLKTKVRIAEQAERYEDMVTYMEELAKIRHQEKKELSVEERNCLSVAYKNVVCSRRAAWRVISSIEQGEIIRNVPGNAQKLSILKDYKLRVEEELDEICERILDVLDKYLLAEEVALMPESRVFYCKMKGDYCRYMAEYKTGDQQKPVSDRALQAYKEVQNITEDGLPSTHPIRLGLALSHSVFQYEIVKNTEEACKLAKKAFDDAITDVDNISEENYRESTLIMQILRDNLTLWTSEGQDD